MFLKQAIPVYLINLCDASARLKTMQTHLADRHLEHIRVEAVHGDQLTDPIQGYARHSYHLRTGKVTNKREIGCYLSHIKALKTFLASEHPVALILEDDAILPTNIHPLLDALLQQSAHWDLVRLTAEKEGHYLPVIPILDGHQLAYNTHALKNTAAYLINRQAAQRCVRKMVPMRQPYDVALDREWSFGVRTLCVVPFPVKLKAGEPGQIPKAKRLRIYRATTFHLFHALTHLQRIIYRNASFKKLKREMNHRCRNTHAQKP